MYIWVRSRSFIEDTWEPVIPTAVISIWTPRDREAKLPKSDLIVKVIRPSFHDISQRSVYGLDKDVYDKLVAENNYILFSDEQAESIAEFVSDLSGVECLMCHCDAGISRSAGVAAAYSKFTTGDDMYFFTNYVPNGLVYGKTLAALYRRKESEKQ